MRIFWTSALALSTAFGFSGMALAQTATSAAADAANEAEEVVVTVQLREQNLIDVPIAVTALGTEFLDRVGVERFEDLALYVPGLEVAEQSTNNPAFTLRGITTDSGESNIEARVAIYQDGVSISRSRGSYVELFDLERVEVARGPQATLFGRGALIGAINLVQNKADLDDVTVSAEAGLGDFNAYRLAGTVNLPLFEDTFALRLSMLTRDRDGTVDNTLDSGALRSNGVTAVRLAAAWAPTDSFRLDLIGNWQGEDNTGTAFKSGTFAAVGGNTDPFTAASLNTFGTFKENRPLGLERQVSSVTALASWELTPSITLSSTTGYRFFDSSEVFDPDGFGVPLFVFAEDAKGRQYTQDLRLGFEGNGPLSAFVGASYFSETGSQRVPLQFQEEWTLGLIAGTISRPNPQSIAAFRPTVAPTLQALAAGAGLSLTSAQAAAIAANFKGAQGLAGSHQEAFANFGETTSVDVYADVTYALTPRFEVTGGVRYTQDDKTTGFESYLENGRSILGTVQVLLQPTSVTGLSTAQRQGLLLALATPGAATLPTSTLFPVPNFGLFVQPTAARASASDEFGDFSWRLVGRYALTDDISTWASYARGRRPDVISPVAPAAPGGAVRFNTIPAETVDSVEAGIRGSFLGGALNAEGSVYAYVYNDFQTTEFQGTRIVTVNAGEARAVGFEGAMDWQVTDALELFGTLAIAQARLESGARDGNQFRNAPDQSVSVGLTYTQALGTFGSLRLTPTYAWQSEVFFDDDNDKPNLQIRAIPSFNDTRVDERQDAFGILNLRAVVETANGRWALEGAVQNALDEDYLIDAGNTGDGFGIPTFIRGTPRTVFFTVSTRF